jgi:hypothetical protein
VADLKGMGLPAVPAAGQPAPQVGDIVLRGYFVSIDEGSAGKRLLVGFGSGTAEMRAAAEGYQMSAQGPRLLGSGEVASEDGRMPGMAARLAVLAVTRALATAPVRHASLPGSGDAIRFELESMRGYP